MFKNPRAPQQRPFLWRASPPKREAAPSYLFGTIHHDVSLEDALGSRGLRYLDNARVVYVETVVPASGELSFWDIYRDMTPGVKRSKRGRILKLLLEHEYQSDGESGGKEKAIMDLFLMNRVREHGTRLQSLELVKDAVMPLVDSLVAAQLSIDQLKTFMTELGSLFDSSSEISEIPVLLEKAYRTGYVREMVAAIGKESSDSWLGGVLARHKNWLPVVKRAISRGGAFVAAGVGHMVWGPDSLPCLLRRTGYRVERVR